MFGKYKVCVMSNKTLASEEGKIPVICGDLKTKPQSIRLKKEWKTRRSFLSVQTILMKHFLY